MGDKVQGYRPPHATEEENIQVLLPSTHSTNKEKFKYEEMFKNNVADT